VGAGPGITVAPREAGAQSADEAIDAPRLARIVRLSATVVAEALIDSTGAVLATNVIRSQPLLDDSAAVEIAGRRFPPHRDAAGNATTGIRTVALRFAAPESDDARIAPFLDRRCEVARLTLVPEFRPDSSGALTVRWSAAAPRSHELRLLVLTPDGVSVDTTGSAPPQRLLDTLDPAVPGWPTWQRSGKELRDGTTGAISLTLPSAPGWSAGRIAFVALFHDAIDRSWIVRQAVYRIEHDAMGPVLLRDALIDECLAGPFRP
jgi:hypothetical protein